MPTPRLTLGQRIFVLGFLAVVGYACVVAVRAVYRNPPQWTFHSLPAPSDAENSVRNGLTVPFAEYKGFDSIVCKPSTTEPVYLCDVAFKFDAAPSANVGLKLAPLTYKESFTIERDVVEGAGFYNSYTIYHFRSSIDTTKYTREQVIQWVDPLLRKALDTASADPSLKESLAKQAVADTYKDGK